MESFRPTRFGINVRLFLFIGLISTLFIWVVYPARLPVNGGVEDRDGYKRVKLQALGYFNFGNDRATIDDVPSRIRKLDGQKIALEGLMYSPTGSMRLRDFQLVGRFDYHGPPLAQQRVFVHSPVEVRYLDGECRVRGTLHVRIEKDETGKVISVFRMDLDKCREL